MKSLDQQLIDASLDGNLNEMKSLIKQGADVNFINERGITALMIAERFNHIEIVELLEQHGAVS